MEIIALDSIPDIEIAGAIGYFDGVHLGHEAVLSAAAESTGDEGRKSAALTFDLTGFRPGGKGGADLMTREQCFERIGALGLDYTVIIPMDAVRSYTPDEFAARILRKQLHVRELFCGEDFFFGKDRAGTAEVLQAEGKELGFTVSVIPSVSVGGVPVSTSRIKEMITSGDVASAASLLGRRYSYRGTVFEDKHLARKLGFPTANQHFPDIFRPKPVVYISETLTGGTRYRSVTNLGTRPTTVGGEYTSETHLLDFSGELVGTDLTVELLSFRRPEVRFPDVKELKVAVFEDIKAAEAYICG